MTAPPRTPGEPSLGTMTGVLFSALNRRAEQRFSGTLVIDGSPGGTVVMRDGLVAAASTPATPGPEPLLLRSGRISETEWMEAFTAGAPEGRLAAELVDRELLGDAGVEVVTRTAVVDAIFAMALSGARTCTAQRGPETTPPVLPADPGLEAEWLIRETARRLANAAAWERLPLTIHSRPRATEKDGLVIPSRAEILDRANGRRTPRDIAFALGRGLYSVMTDLATLIEDGRVEVEKEIAPEPAPQPAPVQIPATLPQRRRGAGKVNDVLPLGQEESKG